MRGLTQFLSGLIQPYRERPEPASERPGWSEPAFERLEPVSHSPGPASDRPGLLLGGGQTNRRMDGRTYTQISPVLYRTSFPLGPLPKKGEIYPFPSCFIHCCFWLRNLGLLNQNTGSKNGGTVFGAILLFLRRKFFCIFVLFFHQLVINKVSN